MSYSPRMRGIATLYRKSYRSVAGFSLIKRSTTLLLFIAFLVSVWIKIVDMQYPFSILHPSRMRGLK